MLANPAVLANRGGECRFVLCGYGEELRAFGHSLNDVGASKNHQKLHEKSQKNIIFSIIEQNFYMTRIDKSKNDLEQFWVTSFFCDF